MKPEFVDDRFEVADERLEREIRDVPVREAGAALVVPYQLALCGQPAEERRPHGTLPIEFEVVQPVGGLDERHAATGRCDGEMHAV